MKVIAVNGSPNKDGNTAKALGAMAEILEAEGVDAEIVNVGGELIRGCVACGKCASSEKNLCVLGDDIVNDTCLKMREADGIILGAPTYYAGIPGPMKACLDRVFFSSSRYFKYKVGTAVAVVRRTGGLDVVHQLMNFFNLAQTVTPPSQYWTVAYGMDAGEVLSDAEGMQTLRKNARSMAWLIKMIAATKGSIPTPDETVREKRVFTNFIR
ncbi:MAG: flavodoxin family protein [Synergistaceae bacterium]|jgi:multimeric flavodoxin WrbA|nr:flavodoxin family protein [Synergistaceae bacterium]